MAGPSLPHFAYTADPPTARTAVLTALHRVDATWPDDRSPFPGLRPFEVDQHRVFFGRADEVGHLAELHGLTKLVDELLLADPTGPQQHLLIVVDQFEELLTQTGPADRTSKAAPPAGESPETNYPHR